MTRERRRGGHWPVSDLEQCMAHALAAKEFGADQEGHAKQAIFWLLQHLGDAAGPLRTAGGNRPDWLAAVRFLDDCHRLPALNGLAVALAELDRGVPSAALAPAGNRRGGKANTAELEAMRTIVEGADELWHECEDDIDFRIRLGECGAPYSTVADHKKRLAEGPAEFRAERSFLMTYRGKTPQEVIALGVALLAAARRQRVEGRE